MRKLLIGLMIVLAFAGVALAPAVAGTQRDGFRGRPVRAGSVVVGGSMRAHAFVRPPFVPHPPFHGPSFRPFVPFGPFAIGSAGVVYDDASAYSTSPTYYDPSAAGLAVAVEPPPPVQYPNGRYEMRGNGTTTPYVWVWVPDPPAAPPEASPASRRSAPGLRIISIPAPPGESAPPSDPTAPKIINIPPPDAPRAARR